jgi:hypothetical protein
VALLGKRRARGRTTRSSHAAHKAA